MFSYPCIYAQIYSMFKIIWKLLAEEVFKDVLLVLVWSSIALIVFVILCRALVEWEILLAVWTCLPPHWRWHQGSIPDSSLSPPCLLTHLFLQLSTEVSTLWNKPVLETCVRAIYKYLLNVNTDVAYSLNVTSLQILYINHRDKRLATEPTRCMQHVPLELVYYRSNGRITNSACYSHSVQQFWSQKYHTLGTVWNLCTVCGPKQ